MAIELDKNGVDPNAPKYCFYFLITFPLIIAFIISLAQSPEAQSIAKLETRQLSEVLTWDIDSDPSLNASEKSIVKNAAQNLIHNEKICHKLRMGGKSTTQEGKYYLQCETNHEYYKPYFNYYFSKEDVENNKILKIIAPLKEKQAWDICFQKKWAYFKYPESIEFQEYIKAKATVDGSWAFEDITKAKNSYGMTILHHIICEVDKQGHVIRFDVYEQ